MSPAINRPTIPPTKATGIVTRITAASVKESRAKYSNRSTAKRASAIAVINDCEARAWLSTNGAGAKRRLDRASWLSGIRVPSWLSMNADESNPNGADNVTRRESHSRRRGAVDGGPQLRCAPAMTTICISKDGSRARATGTPA